MRSSSLSPSSGARWVALLLILLSLSGSVASAQIQPTSTPILDTVLRPGVTVWITDSGGREEKVRIVEVSPDVVRTSSGMIRRTDIVRVRERRFDSVLNGAAIGAGAAVASGLFLCRLTEPWEICNDPGPIARIAALGAGIGIGVDALIRGRRTVFEAPSGSMLLETSPIVAGGIVGLRVSIRF